MGTALQHRECIPGAAPSHAALHQLTKPCDATELQAQPLESCVLPKLQQLAKSPGSIYVLAGTAPSAPLAPDPRVPLLCSKSQVHQQQACTHIHTQHPIPGHGPRPPLRALRVGRDFYRDPFSALRLDPAPQPGCSADPTQRPLCEHSQTHSIMDRVAGEVQGPLEGRAGIAPSHRAQITPPLPAQMFMVQSTEPTPSEQHSQQELHLSCCTPIQRTHLGHQERGECFWAEQDCQPLPGV